MIKLSPVVKNLIALVTFKDVDGDEKITIFSPVPKHFYVIIQYGFICYCIFNLIDRIPANHFHAFVIIQNGCICCYMLILDWRDLSQSFRASIVSGKFRIHVIKWREIFKKKQIWQQWGTRKG